MKITILLLVSLLGLMYTCYWAGRTLERRVYTKYFIIATEATYYEGYTDGQEMGRKQGEDIGYKKCLDEDFDMRDRY